MNTQPAEQQLETLRDLSKEFATALADTQKAMKEEFIRCTLNEFMTIAEGQNTPNVSDESANRPKTDPSKMLNGE